MKRITAVRRTPASPPTQGTGLLVREINHTNATEPNLSTYTGQNRQHKTRAVGSEHCTDTTSHLATIEASPSSLLVMVPMPTNMASHIVARLANCFPPDTWQLRKY